MLIIIGISFIAILGIIYFFHSIESVEFCEECYENGWGFMLKDECRCKAL